MLAKDERSTGAETPLPEEKSKKHRKIDFEYNPEYAKLQTRLESVSGLAPKSRISELNSIWQKLGKLETELKVSLTKVGQQSKTSTPPLPHLVECFMFLKTKLACISCFQSLTKCAKKDIENLQSECIVSWYNLGLLVQKVAPGDPIGVLIHVNLIKFLQLWIFGGTDISEFKLTSSVPNMAGVITHFGDSLLIEENIDLKQSGINDRAMRILNNLVIGVFDRVVTRQDVSETVHLLKYCDERLQRVLEVIIKYKNGTSEKDTSGSCDFIWDNYFKMFYRMYLWLKNYLSGNRSLKPELMKILVKNLFKWGLATINILRWWDNFSEK